MPNFFHIILEVLRDDLVSELLVGIVRGVYLRGVVQRLVVIRKVKSWCFKLDIKKFDLTINGLLVHLNDFLLSKLVDGLEDLANVKSCRVLTDLLLNLRVFWEDVFVDELLGKSESFDISQGRHIDELTLGVVDDVVVTDHLLPGLSQGDSVRLCGASISETESDSNGTLMDKIHLWHFILLVVDDPIFFRGFKSARHKPKSYVVQKPCLVVCTCVEESLMLLKDVGKEINRHNLVLNFVRK